MNKIEPIKSRANFKCKLKGCNREHSARGYCETHYLEMRAKKHNVSLGYNKPKTIARDAKPAGDIRGENGTNAKLTEKEVLEIRDSNLPQKEIAKIYGVQPSCINQIIHRKTWQHI